MRYVLLISFLANGASADPLFEDRSDALVGHVYDGGWEHFVGGGVAVFDCDNNTLPDIFAAGGSNPAALFRNLGDFQFAATPVATITGATGAYPLNIDGDAFMDLFVMRVGANTILRGGPDCTFEDASAILGTQQADRWTTAFTAWWTGNGAPHMAVGNYVDRSDPDGPFEACDDNQILQPRKDELTYDEVTLAPGFCPLSMLAADDARGRPTLRISNDRHYYVRGGYEQMWDISEGRFLDENDGWKNVSLWGMGIASRDLDGDGRDEVMLTSMGDQLMQLALPDGTYRPAPFDLGTYAQRPHSGDDGRPSTGWHAQFADVDNDGRADLFIAKGNVDQMPGNAMRDPNNLLMQKSDGQFVEKSVSAGIATSERSRGAALADLDNDGRLDLIVVNRRAAMELYRNVTEDAGNWLQVKLNQPGGNRDAVGAKITVNANGHSQTQQITVGGGHAGGQMLPLHFGLGDAEAASITVTWPDGSTSMQQADGNQLLNIHRR